ncbi:protein of unknown function [Streptomyces murinus]
MDRDRRQCLVRTPVEEPHGHRRPGALGTTLGRLPPLLFRYPPAGTGKVAHLDGLKELQRSKTRRLFVHKFAFRGREPRVRLREGGEHLAGHVELAETRGNTSMRQRCCPDVRSWRWK